MMREEGANVQSFGNRDVCDIITISDPAELIDKTFLFHM